jgi:uncharacterized Zn finger protein (UPF0148 family)
MDEDEVLSKITRLLEQGCTMLATHHDCGAPLFRRQGEVVCPVCSFADDPDSPVKVLPSGLSGAERDEKSNFDRAHLQERGAQIAHYRLQFFIHFPSFMQTCAIKF